MVTTMIEELVNGGNKYDLCVAIGPVIMMKFTCLLTKKLGIPTVVSMNPDHGRRNRNVRRLSSSRGR